MNVKNHMLLVATSCTEAIRCHILSSVIRAVATPSKMTVRQEHYVADIVWYRCTNVLSCLSLNLLSVFVARRRHTKTNYASVYSLYELQAFKVCSDIAVIIWTALIIYRTVTKWAVYVVWLYFLYAYFVCKYIHILCHITSPMSGIPGCL